MGIGAMTEQGTGRVRALVGKDLPQIVALHEQLFGARGPRAALASYLGDLFFHHPWYDEDLPSLVYEDKHGKVIGCFGVMPRPMSLNGRPIRAAVSHNFMVEPGRRSTLGALHLLKTYLAGPQDLSLAEANQTSRQMWELVGETTPLLYRLRWTRPLRPGRYALSTLRMRGLPRAVMVALSPVARVVDRLAARFPQSPFQIIPPEGSGEELTPSMLAACLTDFPRSRLLRPTYDVRSVTWLLEILGQKTHWGTLRKMLVRDTVGRMAGWYLYYLAPGGVSQVVQLGARDDSSREVLRHLFHDAWRHGAVALSGQVDPGLLQELSDESCLLRVDRASGGVRLHSRDRRLLHAVVCGDAFLTRLEGEWWLPFRGA